MLREKTHLFILLLIITMVLSACTTVDSGNVTRAPEPLESIAPTPSPTLDAITPAPTVTPSPSPSPAPVIEPVNFSILAAGDVMAHGDNLKSAYNPSDGTYSFIENYSIVRGIVETADLAVCNLETVTAGKDSGYTSFPRFNTPSAILDGLEYAGFDVIVTANNHSLDRGEDGILKTLDEISSRDMMSTGTYSEPGINFLTTDIKGYRVSILAYTQHLNGNLPLLPADRHHMVNQMDLESIIKDIEKAESTSDLVIIYLHWGNEYTRSTEDWQPGYAHALIEAGADVILGTHPHVIRPDEVVMHDGEAKYIIYSMGNYISNFIRADNRTNAIYTEDGVMINMNFTVEDDSVILKSVVPIPTWPYKYINETGIHYEIIPVPDISNRLHENDYAHSEAVDSYNWTMESLSGYNTP